MLHYREGILPTKREENPNSKRDEIKRCCSHKCRGSIRMNQGGSQVSTVSHASRQHSSFRNRQQTLICPPTSAGTSHRKSARLFSRFNQSWIQAAKSKPNSKPNFHQLWASSDPGPQSFTFPPLCKEMPYKQNGLNKASLRCPRQLLKCPSKQSDRGTLCANTF